jgi:septal ring factor EnvC (AmiA/AmiB activator)
MFRRPLIFFACLLLATSATAANERLQQNQAALEQLRERIAATQKTLERDQGERDQVAREMQEVERRLSRLNQEVRELRARSQEQNRKVADIQAEQQQSQRALEARKTALRQQLRTAYVIGRNGQTQLLLNLDDVQKVGRVLVYYEYLQRAQTEAIRTINARAHELEAISERLLQEQEQLEQLRAEQETKLAAVQAERSKRAAVLRTIKSRIADESGELKRLQADERSVRQLIESLRETFKKLPPDAVFSDGPFASLKGKLPWPVRGKLLASYGETKAGGKLSWNGHWISASEGTAIRAVARGRVAYVGWMHRYGLIVLLEHSGGYYTLYGHAQAAAVAVGDNVRAGQSIATVGSTGGHESPGLYFELRKGTDAINPRLWLVR